MEFFPSPDKVRIGGRTLTDNGVLYMDYTCTFCEFTFTGTRASAKIVSDLCPSEEIFRAHMGIFADGIFVRRFSIDEREQDVELWSSDAPKTVTIRIMKLSEAAFAKAGIKSIAIDGELLPPPAPASQRRIEFVGDSITCGYGIGAAGAEENFSTATEDPLRGYAYLTAQALGAEYQYVSWSGMGVVSGYVEETVEEPNQGWMFRDIYPYTDSGLENTLGRDSHDKHTKWDHSVFDPQIVVFAEGTNAHSWTRKIPERCAMYREYLSDMIRMIREAHPASYIVLTYGVMDDPLKDDIAAVTESFTAAGDDKIMFVPLAPQDEANDGVGADWHPSAATHKKVAAVMAEKLGQLFGKMGI